MCALEEVTETEQKIKKSLECKGIGCQTQRGENEKKRKGRREKQGCVHDFIIELNAHEIRIVTRFAFEGQLTEKRKRKKNAPTLFSTSLNSRDLSSTERELTNSKSPSIKGRCILTGFSGWGLAPITDEGWTNGETTTGS